MTHEEKVLALLERLAIATEVLAGRNKVEVAEVEARVENTVRDNESLRRRLKDMNKAAEDAHECRRNIAKALYAFKIDGHVYGSRPCATCEGASKALGEPFGCVAYRLRKNLGATR